MTISQSHISSQTFPRHARLLSRAQFQSVFDQTQCRSTDRCLTILARKNGDERARLGLAISKRCAKNAVVRNRIKRMVRESFRHHQAELGGLDIVVLGREAAGYESKPGLHQSLQHHWQRVTEQCVGC